MLRNCQYAHQGQVSLASFNAAHVCSVKATDIRKLFLRPSSLGSKFTNASAHSLLNCYVLPFRFSLSHLQAVSKYAISIAYRSLLDRQLIAHSQLAMLRACAKHATSSASRWVHSPGIRFEIHPTCSSVWSWVEDAGPASWRFEKKEDDCSYVESMGDARAAWSRNGGHPPVGGPCHPPRLEDFQMTPQCSVVSLTDADLTGLVSCVRHRLVVIAPGLSVPVAKAVVETWRRLGPQGVQVVLDPDPEVCRMGYGDVAALKLLQETAEQLRTKIHQQPGLRIGVVVTDETTAIFSPTPLLIEAGGRPGEKPNAIRLNTPILDPGRDASSSDLKSINLEPRPLTKTEVEKTSEKLKANPPIKFDVARKVRVFNARIEFVEFELRGLAISRKTVQIPADLLGLAKEPRAQRLLHSSFQLIEGNSELSGERVNKLKQFIAKKYLIGLPGYGNVVLRSNKEDFQTAVKALGRYVHRFQRLLKKKLQAAIDANREVLVSALLPGILASPPSRWGRFLGVGASRENLERLLRSELSDAFGSSDKLFREMEVKLVFKGVTYESLNDPDFVRVARENIRSLDLLHEEYDTARAEGQLELHE